MAKLTSAKARKILHDKSVHGQPLTDKQRRFFGAIAGGAKPYKAESGGWLDKYDAPIAQNGIEGTMGGLTDKGFNYNGAWGGTMQMGGNLTFLEPTSRKLPMGHAFPYKDPSTELAISVGGEGGEPAYLIPSFKYGKYLTDKDAKAEFRKTGEHLGGPFKTWQEADEWERTVRHPYVEKGQSIPTPLRRWGKDFAMGGSLPGAVGFTYARTAGAAPANGPYAKKTKASAQKGKAITKREDFEPWWNWASRKAGDVDERQDAFGTLGDLYAYYAGQPLRYNVLENSEYKPTNAKDPNAKYISINDPKFKQEVFDKYNDVFIKKELGKGKLQAQKINDNTYSVSGYTPATRKQFEESKKLGTHPVYMKGKDYVSNAIGRYFISKGKDEKGDYISYYDTFDEGSGPDGGGIGEMLKLTKPFEIYDRIYIDPKTGKPKMQDGGSMKYYQEGLDFKPKTISQDGTVIDPMGYWNPENVGNPVIIPSNEITMEGVDQPLIGISDTGDVQYMQPGEDYTFDGEYVTEYPVAQKGTKVPAATTADSLALFNNAQKIVDYYKSKNYRTKRMDYGENPYAFNQLDEAREAFLKHSLVTVPTTSKKLKFVAPKDIENLYYKNVDKNKFYQRENANAILDTRSPMPLYDRRITPTAYMAFDNVNENDPLHLDIVSISGYDPIAVKPYAMLTPEEKKLREQRYGKPKKETPKSSIKPKTKIEQPIKKTEQPKPVERKQNVYEGTPVYAPTPYSPGAGAVVGFVDKKGDTTYIKPEDYERMGVPKYGRDFIQKKMKNGGVSVNMADQYPIEKLDQSLNFTNYNKPTKGGWLDKYK